MSSTEAQIRQEAISVCEPATVYGIFNTENNLKSDCFENRKSRAPARDVSPALRTMMVLRSRGGCISA